MCGRAHFGHSMLLFLIEHLAFRDMWLQTFVEVEYARNRIDDSNGDQE